MSTIKVILNSEEELQGEDCMYREPINVEVEQDVEDNEKLKVTVKDKSLFISKEDIKTLIYVFKL